MEQLDDLSDLLGDEHHLTVLIEHLERAAGGVVLGDVDVDGLIELAGARRSTLQVAAMHLGEQVYGDGVERIVARLVGPWSDAGAGGPGGEGLERERTFLVADMPDLPDGGTRTRVPRGAVRL